MREIDYNDVHIYDREQIHIEAMSKSDSDIYSTRTCPIIRIVTLQRYQTY